MPLMGVAAHCFALLGAAAEIGASADARWAVGNREAALGGQQQGVGSKGSVTQRVSSNGSCEEGTTSTSHFRASKS